MRALNKAVIRRWYSVASASVTRSGCENACPSRKSGFTGSATRKPRGGCYGQMNRHGKKIAFLARIQSRFHATLYSFPERVRPDFHRQFAAFTAGCFMSRMDKVQTNKMKIAASGKVLIVKGIAAFGAEFRRVRRIGGLPAALVAAVYRRAGRALRPAFRAEFARRRRAHLE